MRLTTLLILLFAFVLGTRAQSDAEKVRATISKNDIQAHIFFLASDELKGRATGSAEIDIAASYLANHLRRYGVKPAGDDNSYYQQVKFEKIHAPEAIAFKTDQFSGEKFINLQVDNAEYKGEAVYLGYGTEEDFKAADVRDKLVLVTEAVKQPFRNTLFASIVVPVDGVNLTRPAGRLVVCLLTSLLSIPIDRLRLVLRAPSWRRNSPLALAHWVFQVANSQDGFLLPRENRVI